MVGNYLNQSKNIENFIKKWINNSINNKSWEKISDIHLNEINECFKEKSTWINGSLFVYNIMVNFIDTSIYQIDLFIPLSFVMNSPKIKAKNILDFEPDLYITPPSFYLFPVNYLKNDKIKQQVIFLKKISNKLDFNVFYKENQKYFQYIRHLYVTLKK
jgi:hypothetical protein